MRRLLIQMFIATCLVSSQSLAAAAVYLEDMTWPEVREQMQAGADIAIIPTGGTEQNGPHIITGKHNIIVRYTAGEIAKRLGHTLVAPVIAYVPEGRISPPEGHMQFPGTLSVRDETFAMLLEDAAASLRQHGFRLICFVGDHGGSQHVQTEVAERLTQMWQSTGTRVINVNSYYDNNGQEAWLESIGVKVQSPQAHAGIFDTSEMLSLNSQGVRSAQIGVRTEKDYRATGAMGDSTKASANYGRRLLSLKIEAAVAQIQNASARPQ